MSKNVNLDEFFTEISSTIVSGQSNLARYDFTDRNMKFNFSSFNTHREIGYFQSDVICNDFLRHSHDKGLDYSFLFFNVGKNAIKFKTKECEMILDGGEFWIGNMKDSLSGLHEFENKSYETQCITIQTSLAQELGLLEGLNLNRSVSVRKLKIDSEQLLPLHELKNSNIFIGKMQEIYMESKILELLYKSLENKNDKKQNNFNEEDVKMLEKARKILLGDIKNPPSIKELAHICSTNEFKLKKCFKEYFGITVYGLLANERLNLAQKLLKSGDISVTQAAQSVGYANISHFAKIFKLKFGVLPTQFSGRKKYVVF
jgi:transcriptional regulator, araC family